MKFTIPASLLVLASCFSLSTADQSQKLKINPATGQFTSPDGLTDFIFHGLNVVGKEAFEPLSDLQIDQMEAWGLNVVRLGFSWDLYETAPGVYDEEYLSGTKDIVHRLAARGIYSFLDMHQDLWSKQYCGGHGVPGKKVRNKYYIIFIKVFLSYSKQITYTIPSLLQIQSGLPGRRITRTSKGMGNMRFLTRWRNLFMERMMSTRRTLDLSLIAEKHKLLLLVGLECTSLMLSLMLCN